MPKSAAAAESARAWAPAVTASLLSGAAALVYQVLWTRSLGLVLGTTVAAVAVVLAVFMGGLGAGAALAARGVDALPRRRLPQVYAGLEIGIALFGIGVAPLCRVFPPWLAALYADGDGSPVGIAAARVAVSALLLLPPALLMGATLPTLAALVSDGGARIGRAGGLLYAANTVGAVCGSLGAALVLVPGLGMTGATAVAAALNLGAAALVARRAPPPAEGSGAGVAIAATEPGERTADQGEGRRKQEKRSARKLKRAEAASTPGHDASLPGAAGEALSPRIVLLSLALSGFGALLNEVAWTRSLVLLIGPTAYAFAFVVAAVIAGLAVGSFWAAARADRVRYPRRALGLVEVAAAAACLAVVQVVGLLPVPIAEMVRAHLDRPGHLLLLELVGVTALLAAPSLLFGAAFPLALAALGRSEPHPGRAVGRASAWNTAGAIVGALLAGFVLLPRLGSQRSLQLAAFAHAAAGALALAAAPGRGRWTGLAALPAAALVSLALPRWDPKLFSGGAYKYAPYADAADLEGALRAGDLLYFREGASATVSVRRRGATLSLAVDGKVDATSSGDMMTQRLLAHVPLALHPGPRQVLVIGFGSGVTAGAALDHEQAQVDAVEISPEVVEASSHFDHVNGRPREDRRLRLLLTDGRNHLLLSRKRYDVIVSEPSNPWMAGVSGLFTRDFFRLGRDRLAAGGLFCQWIHVYNLAPDDLRTVVGSFTDAFPDAALFELNEGDALLVGARDGFEPLSPRKLEERLQRLGARGRVETLGRGGRERPSAGPLGSRVFASLFTLGGPALLDFARDAPRHTDDQPLLELHAARSLWADTAGENHRRLREAARPHPAPEPFASLRAGLRPEDLEARGALLERANSFSWAFDAYRDAVEADPGRLAAHEGLVRCAVKTGRSSEATSVLDALAARPGEVQARIGRALLAHNQDEPEAALRLLAEALRLEPRSLRARLLAAEVQAQTGNAPAVAGLARQALAIAPDDAEAGAFLAWSHLAEGRPEEALAQCESILARDPASRRALEVGALASAELGRADEARSFFARLAELEPEGAGYLVNFARFELNTGASRSAALLFERAVDVDPGNNDAWRGLRDASRRAGDTRQLARAERVLSARGIR